MADKLPLPEHMSAMAKARVKADELLVGGAPPIKELPRFDKMPPPHAIPRQAEKEQLPMQPGRRRSPEEIKSDFEKAAAMMGEGKVTPTNRPEDARPLADTSAPTPAKKAEPPKEPPNDDDAGPTLGDLPEFSWDSYHMKQENADFRNPRLREAVESRNPDVALEDLILYESVEQRQIIIPGKLEVVYRSLTASEDLAIKDYIYRVIGSQRYVVDMLTLMTLTCGLKSFNNADLPDHMKTEAGDRVWDDEKFEAKLKIVKSLGIQVVSLLSIVYYWFDERIRKQLVSGILGKS